MGFSLYTAVHYLGLGGGGGDYLVPPVPQKLYSSDEKNERGSPCNLHLLIRKQQGFCERVPTLIETAHFMLIKPQLDFGLAHAFLS